MHFTWTLNISLREEDVALVSSYWGHGNISHSLSSELSLIYHTMSVMYYNTVVADF